MQVKALNRFPFGMRYLDKDEVVEMPDVQARVFIKVGLVEEYKEPKPKRQYKRRDVVAETDDEVKLTRTYRRRDVTAEPDDSTE